MKCNPKLPEQVRKKIGRWIKDDGEFSAANFGNAAAITISYISNNPLVPFTYGQFPGTTWGAPLHIGLVHVQKVRANQASKSLFVLRHPGTGKFEGMCARCKFTLAEEREIKEQQLAKI